MLSFSGKGIVKCIYSWKCRLLKNPQRCENPNWNMANPTTKNGLRLISAKISLPWQLECNSFNAFGVLFIVPICATHLYVTVAPPLIFRVPVLVDFNCAPVFRFWILVGGAGVVLLAPELERKLAVLWASRTMEALNGLLDGDNNLDVIQMEK